MLKKLIKKYTCDKEDSNYRICINKDKYYINIDDTNKLIKIIYEDLSEGSDITYSVEEHHHAKGKLQPILCIPLDDSSDINTITSIVHNCQKAVKHMIKLPDNNDILQCAVYSKDNKAWIRFTEFTLNNTTLINKVLPAAKVFNEDITYSSLVPLPLSLQDFNLISYTDSEPVISNDSMIEWLEQKGEITDNKAVSLILKKFSLMPQLCPASKKTISTLVPKDKKETKADITKRIKLKTSIRSITDKVAEPTEDPIELLPDIFKIYSYSRIKDRITWKEIGEALYNTFSDEDLDSLESESYLKIGYKLWKLCTDRLNEVEDDKALYMKRIDTMKSIWESFDVKDEYDDMLDHPSNNLDFTTLKFWAQIDNPKEYDRFTADTLQNWLLRSLNVNASDTEIADVVRYKYGIKYKVVSLEPKVVWYEFRRHRWIPIQKARSLRRHLSKDITSLYENLQTTINKELDKYMAKLKADGDEEEINIAVERSSQMLYRCGIIIKALKTHASKNTILNELSEILYDEEFSQVKDENPYLICHRNGVYDLKKDHLRAGRPNDCITLSTNINFKQPLEAHVVMVRQYMAQIFVDESLRHYVWVVIATFLEGYNFMKALYVLIGIGNNSKSAFINLLERVLGEYVFKLPIGIITHDSTSAEGPSPALARGKGRRLAVFDELNKDGRIKDGPMKRITGNTDKQLCRNLYEAPFEYRPQFKSLLVTNNRIQATPDQPAVLDRINEIVFESKFSKACPVTIEEQIFKKHFPIDISFDKKFPMMAEAFLYILTKEYYKIFKEQGIVEPKCIRDHRKKMLRSCDVYEQFREEMIEEDEDDSINSREAYNEFKDWFKEEYGKDEPPNKQDFIHMMTKRLGVDLDVASRSWSGLSLKGKSIHKRSE